MEVKNLNVGKKDETNKWETEEGRIGSVGVKYCSSSQMSGKSAAALGLSAFCARAFMVLLQCFYTFDRR